MSQITSITPQKTKKDRFNIFIDGQFAFSVDRDTLVKNNLRIDQNLSSDQVQKLLKESILGKLIDQSLKFLSYRPRSQKEVSTYLVQKIAQKENLPYLQAQQSLLVSQVITKLKKYHYLDDYQFAKWLVKSRTKSKPRGSALIKFELLQKGISQDIIDNVLVNSANQQNLAQKAIIQKILKWQKLPPLKFKTKIYQYLKSRGFDYDTIHQTFAFFVKKR